MLAVAHPNPWASASFYLPSQSLADSPGWESCVRQSQNSFRARELVCKILSAYIVCARSKNSFRARELLCKILSAYIVCAGAKNSCRAREWRGKFFPPIMGTNLAIFERDRPQIPMFALLTSSPALVVSPSLAVQRGFAAAAPVALPTVSMSADSTLASFSETLAGGAPSHLRRIARPRPATHRFSLHPSRRRGRRHHRPRRLLWRLPRRHPRPVHPGRFSCDAVHPVRGAGHRDVVPPGGNPSLAVAPCPATRPRHNAPPQSHARCNTPLRPPPQRQSPPRCPAGLARRQALRRPRRLLERRHDPAAGSASFRSVWSLCAGCAASGLFVKQSEKARERSGQRCARYLCLCALALCSHCRL